MKAVILAVLALASAGHRTYSCEDHLDPAVLAFQERIANWSCGGVMTSSDIGKTASTVAIKLDVLLKGLAAKLEKYEREQLLSAQSKWFAERDDYCLWVTSNIDSQVFDPTLTELCETSVAASRIEELCVRFCQGSGAVAECRDSCFCKGPDK